MTLTVVAAVVERDGRFLLTRRPAGVHLEGLWEFPGGKTHAAETHADALRRELREELGTDAVVGDLVLATTHAYPDRTVILHFYRCDLTGPPRPLLGQEMAWIQREKLSSMGLPPADEELIQLLVAGGE